MPRYVRIGDVEPDAVPRPMFIYRGFQENETAADAFSPRFSQLLGGRRVLWGFLPLKRGSTKGWCGIV